MPPTSAANRARTTTSARRLPVVPITIAVVVLLGLVAVLATRGGDDGEDGLEQTRPVTVTGDPLVPFPDGPDPAVGRVAPALDGAGFDGAPVRIGADGRPKVLVYLAHWCPHCQRELPVLAGWLADHGPPDDVDLYGIATATSPDRPNYPPSSWLEDGGWTPPVLADDAEGTAGLAMGLSAYPFYVVLDGDNTVTARASGELTVEQWEELLAHAGP